MNEIEPTQQSFTNMEQMAIDVLTTKTPTIMTKTGSVVRELLVRPLAYLASWINENIDNTIKKSSLNYLSTSQATSNSVCDDIASMFFVTRRQGTYAKGIITVTLSSSIVTIPNGASFIIDGHTVKTSTQYIITNTPIYDNTVEDVVYITSIPIDNTYIANIPVQAADTGAIEIPVGTDIVIDFAGDGIISAELTSPITGGSGVETDAELIKRAEYTNAAGGIGTYYGIQKKFNKAPVAIIGMAVVSGEDALMHRGRYNSTNINPGGSIDCYIKTSNQPVTETISVTCTSNGELIVDDSKYANLLTVKKVAINGRTVNDIKVSFGASASSMLDAASARLSMHQKTILTSSEISSGDVANVTVIYMPNIDTVQTYMDSDEEKFIGQDVVIKAAVPVSLTVSCCASKHSGEAVTEEEKDIIANTISTYVNSMPVGSASINYSDIRKACSSVLPEVDLRLPCIFGCSIYLKDGSMDYFYTNTGILDISDTVNQGYWEHGVCYFFTCKSNIRIETL